MSYVNFEDKVIRKLARHQKVVSEGGSYVAISPPDPTARARIDAHFASAKLVSSGMLADAYRDLKMTESKIKKLKLTQLPSREIASATAGAKSMLITKIESRTSARILELYNMLDKRQKAEASKSTTPNLVTVMTRLERLETSKLDHTFTDESEATAKLAAMARTGYSESEAKILGSKGPRAHVRMKELFAELPPSIADETGIEALKELERLVSLKPGEIPYFLAGAPDVPQKVNVSSLLTETSPSLADVTIE